MQYLKHYSQFWLDPSCLQCFPVQILQHVSHTACIAVHVSCITCCPPLHQFYLVFGLASIWTPHCRAILRIWTDKCELCWSFGILAVKSQIPLQEAQHAITCTFLHNPVYMGIPWKTHRQVNSNLLWMGFSLQDLSLQWIINHAVLAILILWLDLSPALSTLHFSSQLLLEEEYLWYL